jgi:hypothetical protein
MTLPGLARANLGRFVAGIRIPRGAMLQKSC